MVGSDWMCGLWKFGCFCFWLLWLLFNRVGIVAFMISFVIFVLLVGLDALVLAGLRCFCGCWFVLFVLIWVLRGCCWFRL